MAENTFSKHLVLQEKCVSVNSNVMNISFINNTVREAFCTRSRVGT